MSSCTSIAGLTQYMYRRLKKGLIEFTFTCRRCLESHEVFQAVVDLLPSKKVTTFVADFEIGIWQGIRDVFNDTLGRLCGGKDPLSPDDSFEVIDHVDLLSAVLYTTTSKHAPALPIDISSNTLSSHIQNVVSPISKRTEPLGNEDFARFLDPDGRLVDESSLRKTVFLGGVEPGARKEVWKFLFGLYPCSSTKRERDELLLDYIVKYHEMKSRWKTLLALSAPPGATPFEQGLVARYQLDDLDQHLHSPEFRSNDPIYELGHGDGHTSRNENSVASTALHSQSEPDFTSLTNTSEGLDVNSDEIKQKIDFMKIQAQVYVNRHKIDVNGMKGYLRLIDKDVPRTDRDYPYFMGPRNPHLSMLRDILITYASFHPVVGYAQGMNDILARFLVVFDSEVEAYWCFHNYLEKIHDDFTETGMVKKIELVRKLLLEMDRPLLQHFEKHDLGDLIFCHRWLLLGFKREFSFMDSLRVFEILSSHHLELSSLEAETARRRQQMKEFADTGGITRSTPLDGNLEFTFELFMCVALLQQCRAKLLQAIDPAMVFDCINHVKIDMDTILEQSEHVFFRYCKKNVEDSFLLVDTPPTR